MTRKKPKSAAERQAAYMAEGRALCVRLSPQASKMLDAYTATGYGVTEIVNALLIHGQLGNRYPRASK